MQNQDSTVQPTSESLPIGNAMLPEVRASKKHELAEKWIKELSDAGFTHDDMIALFAKQDASSQILKNVKIKKMTFFKETEEVFVCEKCKQSFKSYHYYEDCENCHDGETEDGEECHACGGMGEHNSIVKDQCQGCLYLYLINDD